MLHAFCQCLRNCNRLICKFASRVKSETLIVINITTLPSLVVNSVHLYQIHIIKHMAHVIIYLSKLSSVFQLSSDSQKEFIAFRVMIPISVHVQFNIDSDQEIKTVLCGTDLPYQFHFSTPEHISFSHYHDLSSLISHIWPYCLFSHHSHYLSRTLLGEV